MIDPHGMLGTPPPLHVFDAESNGSPKHVHKSSGHSAIELKQVVGRAVPSYTGFDTVGHVAPTSVAVVKISARRTHLILVVIFVP